MEFGARETLDDGECGDIVFPESVGDLSEAIALHLLSPERLMGKAREPQRSATRLSVKLCAARYDELIRHIHTGSPICVAINQVAD